jgi:small subunit ribosomal protein S20
MANHASARKRVRRNERRDVINTNRLSRMRTFIKKVEMALAGGNAQEAEQALRDAQPEIQRGVVKGLLKKNTAARKISRLSARVKALK